MVVSTRASSMSRLKAIKIVPVFFLQTALLLGTIKSIGVFLPQLKLKLGITSTDIGISLGLFQAFTFGISAMPAYIYCNAKNIYRRLMVVGGAILASGGLIFGSTIANNAQLAFYLSICGIGMNLLSTSSVMALHSKAGDHFKILYGISKSGYSFGMALIPLLADYLMTTYDWRGSLMILGGIMTHLVPFSLLVDTTIERDEGTVGESPLAEETPEEKPHGSQKGRLEDNPVINQKDVTKSHSFLGTLSNAITTSIFYRDRWLTVLVFTTGIYGTIGGGWHAFLIPRAVSRGFSTSRALALAYSSGGGCFIGRCFSGAILNTKFFSCHDWFNLLTVINCISLLADILFSNFGLVIITSFVSALSIGARNVLLVLLYKERIQSTDFPTVYAVSDIIVGSAQFLGAFMSGFLADVFHNFNASFIFLLAVEAFILAMMVILKLTKNTSQERI